MPGHNLDSVATLSDPFSLNNAVHRGHELISLSLRMWFV